MCQGAGVCGVEFGSVGKSGMLVPPRMPPFQQPPPTPFPQGELYQRKAEGTAGSGGVALVLGAGNQLPVVALDILHKLVGGLCCAACCWLD